jgi:hypothetical protein
MTLQELKVIFNWVANNYDVKNVDDWHPSPNTMLEEFLEDYPNVLEKEKKEDEE